MCYHSRAQINVVAWIVKHNSTNSNLEDERTKKKKQENMFVQVINPSLPAPVDSDE
jgi:hypothetical protein